jgi:hypothetical protein
MVNLNKYKKTKNMKKIVGLLAFFLTSIPAFSQIFIAESCSISMFSATKMENIDATNSVTRPVLNCSSGEIVFKVTNTSFKFKSQLMQDHFNENYMESDKFPYCIFKGKINDKLDCSANGGDMISVTGKLDVHGVEKDRTIDGTIKVKDGKMTIHSKFKVKLADHNIKVPSVVTYNIADDIEITIDAVFIPYVKTEAKN